MACATFRTSHSSGWDSFEDRFWLPKKELLRYWWRIVPSRGLFFKSRSDVRGMRNASTRSFQVNPVLVQKPVLAQKIGTNPDSPSDEPHKSGIAEKSVVFCPIPFWVPVPKV